MDEQVAAGQSLLLSRRADRMRRLGSLVGQSILLVITSSSILAVLFIFYFIGRDAVPFFRAEGFREFFTSTDWYPSADPPALRGAGHLLRQRDGHRGGDPRGRAAGRAGRACA